MLTQTHYAATAINQTYEPLNFMNPRNMTLEEEFNYLASLSSSSSATVPTSKLDIDNFPLHQLLQSDWWQQNLSQTLNITVDNLTSLLHNTPQHETQMDRLAMPYLATLSIFYVLIFLAGVLGNLITCIVISRNKFMHTATNFYLFNLAVSDIILLVSGMPQELYNLWYPDSFPFTDVLCVVQGVISETAANATVLTITAFTVERYIAICHPFRQHTMSKLSRAIKFIFAIWIMAFLLALPQAMQFSVEDGSCTMKNYFFAHVFAVSGFIFFCGPMTAICVLYVLIGVKLKRSRLLQAVPRRCYDVNRGISAQSRVIRMLVAVAVAFFLCWAPFHAQRLLAVYGSTSGIDSELLKEIYHILLYTSGVLYFLSTCINPLLYNIMSHKFREAFKVTLVRQFGLGGGKNHQTPQHYSALLRQNGSMRLNTTVNNNFNSYRVVHLHCRDPSHHLSLQDSIRTTTTTTTMSGEGRGNGNSSGNAGVGSSRRSSHRNRCISAGSQATILTSLSKNDVFASNHNSNARNTQTPEPVARGSNALDHMILKTQLSQLSSVGDANSLMDAEIGSSPYLAHSHANNSYRLKELRRSKALKNKPPDDCISLDSIEDWTLSEDQLESTQPLKCAEQHETELYTKPVAPQLMAAALVATQPLGVQTMHTIAELPNPSRSRLKLSRIISRREKDALVSNSSPRVELMRAPLPGLGHATLNNPNIHKPLTSNGIPKRKVKHRTLENLTEKFRWKSTPKKNNSNLHTTIHSDGASLHHSDDNTSSALRIAYAPSSNTAIKSASVHQEDVGNCLNYGTPLALR